MSGLNPTIGGVKLNKITWGYLRALLVHILTASALQPADRSNLMANVEEIDKIVDSDGDGVADDKDADPKNPDVQ